MKGEYILREELLAKMEKEVDDFFQRFHAGELNGSRDFNHGMAYGYLAAMQAVHREGAARPAPEEGRTSYSNAIYEFENLTYAERWLFAIISGLSSSSGECFAETATLAKMMHASKRYVLTSIASLEGKGLIHRKRDGRGRVISLSPLGGEEVQHT